MKEARERAFEALVGTCAGALERLVYYKVRNAADAQDIIQDVLLRAYEKLDALEDQSRFKPWLLSMAERRVVDYYRAQKRAQSRDLRTLYEASYPRHDGRARQAVLETLDTLNAKDRAVLSGHYLRELPIGELARLLRIPEGTVKTRLQAARRRFREAYPYPMGIKGGFDMSVFPEQMPEIEIIRRAEAPFAVRCEQDTGWFIVPRLGERARYAFYDWTEYPAMKKTGETAIQVVGEAQIHGIDCLEIAEVEVSEGQETRYTLFERLTEERIQTLAALSGGAKKRLSTFLDEDFLLNWGMGEDNRGEEITRRARGDLLEGPDGALTARGGRAHCADVAGRYALTIGGRAFDTIRWLTLRSDGILTECYIDARGRTLLFRRFNRADWRGNAPDFLPWSERFPRADRITANGAKYVHWYNCIPDYALAD